MPQLIIKRGRVQIDRFPLSQEISTVGRAGSHDDPVDLELRDSSRRVSRYHAAFVRDRHRRYWVVDLFSSNGTQVNGEMVYQKQLVNSDVIQIGDFRIIYDESELTQPGLPLLVLVDQEPQPRDGLTGESTVIREEQAGDVINLTDKDKITLNDIVTRLKHIGPAGAMADELINLLVPSFKADCGFIAVTREEGVLLPLAAHGFDRRDSTRYQVSQECVQVALTEGRSILRSVHNGVALCCPLTDRSNQTGVVYLHSRDKGRFEETADGLLDNIRAWIEDNELNVLSQPDEPGSTSIVSGKIEWPTSVVTANHKMRDLLANLDRIAESESSILLFGETGTGKEILARRIHQKSKRASGPWHPVELSAVESPHIDGLLFGWKRGAFTTAESDRRGAFEMADGGTLFLDEIGDTDLNVQAKLRRAVEEKQILRLGEEKPRHVDTRVLAATNVDLEQAVEDGTFRKDLLMRFTSIEKVPPLRDRLQDLPLLINYFIHLFDGSLTAVSRGAMRLLYRYSWPGNVREVRQMVRHWNTQGKEVAFSWDVPEKVIKEVAADGSDTERFRTMKQIEKEEIIRVLRKTRGNVEEARRILGYGGKQTVYNKIESHGLSLDEFRKH